MKTKKTLEAISSEIPSVTVPASWREVNACQFRIICNLFAADIFESRFDSILFLRLAGIKVIGFGNNDGGDSECMVHIKDQLYLIGQDVGGYALECIQWVHSIPFVNDIAHLMTSVHKSSIDPKMSKSTFGEFIAADSIYSGYIATGRHDLADRLVRVAWPRIRKIRPWHRPAAVIWFSSLKKYLQITFEYLFAEADQSDMFAQNASSPAAVKESVNAQIRALTKGDITAEERVLAASLYRALTELDQLAKEYQEIKNIGK